MKKIVLVAMLLAGYQSVNAQVFSGTQEVEKTNKEGIYTSIAVHDKYVKQEWQLELAKYGKVETGKSGAYRVNDANMPTISSNPLTLISRISNERGRTKIFMSIGMGEEIYVGGTHAKYPEAEKILNNFIELINLQENVRTEEKVFEDVLDKQKKAIKTGDKLVRSIEDNKRGKEKLLKKIDENKIELDKLLRDTEYNKKDQIMMSDNVNLQLKKLGETKANNLQENIRIEEKALEDVMEKQKKTIKTGDKLVNSIEDNKREKEKLLKKIDENKVELEKLLRDIEYNKEDQILVSENVKIQMKKLGEAKAKATKQ